MIQRATLAALYVGTLVVLWSVVPFLVASIVGWLLLRFRIIRNRRSFEVVLIPVLAALERVITMFWRLLPIVIVALLAMGYTGTVGPPPSGTPDRLFAERAFGVLFVLFLAVALPWSLGIPLIRTAARTSFQTLLGLRAVRWHGGVLVGLVAWNIPGDHGWVTAISTYAYAGTLAWATLMGLASTNASAAPVVREVDRRAENSLVLLQISDVRVTHPEGAEPVGGGRAGNSELSRLVTSIKEGRISPPASWRRILFIAEPKVLGSLLVSPLWASRWYDLFPLRVPAEVDSIEFVILNSTLKEPRLGGSAWGRCGTEQLERLRLLLEQCQARTVVVLFQHAPFRWSADTDIGLHRWAFLVHDANESQQLSAILGGAPSVPTIVRHRPPLELL